MSAEKKESWKSTKSRSIPTKYITDGLEELLDFDVIPQLDKCEKYGQLFSLCLFVFSWIYFGVYYQKLPDSIPVSFDLNGDPEQYANRSVLLAYPVIHTFLSILFTLMERIPNRFRYPIQLNQQNYQFLYQNGRKLILQIKICTNSLFFFLIIGMIEVVVNKMQPRYMLFSLLFFAFYGVPVYFFYKKCKVIDSQNIVSYTNGGRENDYKINQQKKEKRNSINSPQLSSPDPSNKPPHSSGNINSINSNGQIQLQSHQGKHSDNLSDGANSNVQKKNIDLHIDIHFQNKNDNKMTNESQQNIEEHKHQ